MNEVFEYGQKVIFKSNSKEFLNENVKEWLDKLYDMLEKNSSLKIKVTWYYGGVNSTLPLERAETVKKYLVKKWIADEKIQAEWGKEQIAKSIKIEIMK
jgi:outer membrane protein OmpA-like peptidoglycan-associated protein